MQGRLNLAGVLAVIGAIVLLVGLSLDWYEPGISAWTTFEIVDLLLAAIAVGVVVVALAQSPERPRLQAAAAWLPIAALAALVLVIAALVNPPPAAIDRSVEIGAWVSLGAALLLAAAALLATTELSVVVAMRPRPPRRPLRGEGRGAVDETAWGQAEEPFEEPPTDESVIADPDANFAEPVDEVVPADDLDSEEETQQLRRGLG